MPAFLVEDTESGTEGFEDLLSSSGDQAPRSQESYIGRLAQEKGELRHRVGTLEGLVDKALNLRDPSTAGKASPEKKADPFDFQRKPAEATQQIVSEAISPVQQKLDELDLKAKALDFERAHPTAVNDINDPEFIAFVEKSSRRQRLAQQAFGDPSRLDFEAAESLWESWEEYRDLRASVAPKDEASTPPQTPPQKQAQTPPSLVSSGSSSGNAGDSSGKPVYSAAALQRLQLSDPEKYWAPDIQAKIQEAYAEGRVKFP
jgi:hypothetical protein